MSVWVSSKKASPSICCRRRRRENIDLTNDTLILRMLLAERRRYLSLKRSSVFFTPGQSFDKTGHLKGKRGENSD